MAESETLEPLTENNENELQDDENKTKEPSTTQKEKDKNNNEPEEELDIEQINSRVYVPPSGFWKTLFSYLGPSFFVSVGYIDPGNWATDIEAGSRFGYQLLWVLLMSNVSAILLQSLASRLGVVTGFDLAQMCRLQYPKPIVYILWFLCEIAIAATDMAEVLGTAIGLNLLFKIPMLIGVLLTSLSTLLFLLIQRYGIRMLEIFILALLSIISLCIIVELFLTKPNILSLLRGFVPTLTKESAGLAVGIVGATVMPHNFYLHSSLVQTRILDRSDNQQIKRSNKFNLIDLVFSLNVAFFVNASIMIVAAGIFYPNEITDFKEASEKLAKERGRLAPIVFAIALFCAGQSSTITGTMAGQIVMQGFLQLKMRPWIRNLFTRVVAILPAAIVIGIVGEQSTQQLLVLSQVILSLQLPFAIIPLTKFTSSRKIMGKYANPLLVIIGAWFVIFVIIGNTNTICICNITYY
eukprot:TRINITY_DN8006_c0_g1_i1.p1 TRINITY_DN8006_c0_g1~~TRINITY_DN8006_c0_g1_i1.p1  ORF type:complete len:467 (-),score=54.35 TRINITY_DN8006_c0_g1_i1:409-1809(-)